MTWAIGIAIYACGAFSGMGLLVLASIIGDWLQHRAEQYPRHDRLPEIHPPRIRRVK